MKVKFLLILSAAFMLCSCTTSRKLTYFQDIPQGNQPVDVDIAPFVEPRIQADDILAINVNTVDPEAAQVINVRNTLRASNNSNNNSESLGSGGYLVDKAGMVEIPVLGKIKLAGLTTYEAKELIHRRAAEFYKDPVVNVRFSNFRVTVLGEVNRPATYTVPYERVTLLDAIGYAGDLTAFGKRGNVMLIRKNEQGKSQAVRLNLKEKELMKSPYFYLKQNDVVYVEPSKARGLSTDRSFLSYASLGISLASLYVLLIRFTSLGD